MVSLTNLLNMMNPAASRAKLGDRLAAVIALLNGLRVGLLYSAISKAGLAIGTLSKKAVRITNTTIFVNNGVALSKSAAEVAFTASAHDIAGVAGTVREAVYTVSLAANGDPALTKGVEASGAGKALIPKAPAGHTPIGHVRIAVDAGATPFDATSDDLDAAHLTVTYVDTMLIADHVSQAVDALN